MLLELLAVGLAFFAIVKATEASDRIRKLENDRESLLARLSDLHRQVERLQAQEATRARVSVKTVQDLSPSASPMGPDVGTPQAVGSAAAPPSEPLILPSEPDLKVAPVTAPAGAAVKAPASPRPAEALPPPAPAPPRPAPPPPSPPVDWESLLGVKGAAWVGGIALITSAIFFARWTIDQGLLTPEARFAMMLFAGTGALIAAEMGLRKGYERTANPLSGAGIAILYIAFFAGHSRYDLISMPGAFVGMVFVTVTAGVLAVRYDAFPTALLGLLGGFVTPVALSTGEDRPVGLFSYILLLNIGLVAVGAKRRWPGLFELGLLGTLLIQVFWFAKFMSPQNMVVGVVSFFIFGLVYLVLPIASHEEEDERVLRTGAIGGVAPFLFAVFLAGSPRYVDQWPLLFGMIALLDGAILAFAVLRSRVSLLLSASLATSLTVAIWAAVGLKADSGASIFPVTLFAIFLAAIFGLARRAALGVGRLDAAGLRVIEVSAHAAWAGLAFFGLIMIGHDRGAPAGPFLTLTAALAILLVERSSRPGRLKGALAAQSMGLAMLIQIWFFNSVSPATLVTYLAVPVLLSILLSFVAGRNPGGAMDIEAEIAVRLSCWTSILGLFLILAESKLAATGSPLFIALAAQVVMVTGSVLRTNATIGLPALLGASAFHLLVWEAAYLKPHQHGMAFVFTALFYLFFLGLPMIVPFARWREAVLPWLTSAMAGPAFFLPFYLLYQDAFGDSAIGLLPVALAAVSAGALGVVSRRFLANPGDAKGARLRLRYLALFAAVAMWFVAVAVPLQLDRQWITLGWAIEAMALCWLFGRLPHRGLPVLAGVLYTLVGLRLLFNPEILGYEPRGWPVFNWILYTYGVATACCLVGQTLLRRASSDSFINRLADAIALNGLLLAFWLVNLEILDSFSTGPYIILTGQSGYSMKLALSAGWGLYAMALLVTGVVKNLKPLRYLSLAFLVLTVAKVFLYDLSELGGIFRVFSFLGLAVALILVSLFYQRFVFRKSP